MSPVHLFPTRLIIEGAGTHTYTNKFVRVHPQAGVYVCQLTFLLVVLLIHFPSDLILCNNTIYCVDLPLIYCNMSGLVLVIKKLTIARLNDSIADWAESPWIINFTCLPSVVPECIVILGIGRAHIWSINSAVLCNEPMVSDVFLFAPYFILHQYPKPDCAVGKIIK